MNTPDILHEDNEPTWMLVRTAKDGDLRGIRTWLDKGGDAACWTVGRVNMARPLVTVVVEMTQIMSSPYAQKKMIQAARQLMGRIDDRSFAREDAEDWRKDYEVSPLGGFASAGADDVALQLLEHCKDSMTQKQWEDLLFKCALGDTGHNMNILLTECALQLEPKGVARVKSLVRQAFGTGRLSPGWAVVEAEMSRRQMDNSTDMPVSLARTPNRI